MNLNLSGKVVIISGGAKGIGQAISLGCAAESAIPVMLDRDGTALSQMEEKTHCCGSSLRCVSMRTHRRRQCERAIQSAQRTSAKIDALVNNAGVNDGVGLKKAHRKNSRIRSRKIFHIITLSLTSRSLRSRLLVGQSSISQARRPSRARAALPATSRRKAPFSPSHANGPSNFFHIKCASTPSFPLRS